MSLYYETLCPYCANFIVNHLAKLFDNGLISVVDLRMVPWGNAWINPDGSLVCQVRFSLSLFLFFFLKFFIKFINLEKVLSKWVLSEYVESVTF